MELSTTEQLCMPAVIAEELWEAGDDTVGSAVLALLREGKANHWVRFPEAPGPALLREFCRLHYPLAVAVISRRAGTNAAGQSLPIGQ